jgi:BirA family transcriptional regulator, biotin operon repressor / biotin---[acetyl-CoA-carboxylase] ligase
MSPGEFAAPWPIARFDAIDSTNEEARRRAASGDFGPIWLQANRQTAGRGRLGRVWDSPHGNLFATALFRYPGPLTEAALTCFSAGLAIIDAARACGVDISALGLKWPNDVLSGPAKLAGILIETGTVHGQVWMAAGFGINVATAPPRTDRETACIADLAGGGDVTAATFLAQLDIAFRGRLLRLIGEGFESTRSDWLNHAAHMGKRVELTPSTGRITGAMRGLDHDGALIIELEDGGLHHVRAGEISILG